MIRASLPAAAAMLSIEGRGHGALSNLPNLFRSYGAAAYRNGDTPYRMPSKALERALRGLSTRQCADVMERHVRGTIADIEAAADALRANPATNCGRLADLIEPGLLAAAREWQAPPGRPRTAANLEVVAMNAARLMLVVGRLLIQHAHPEMSEADQIGAHEMVSARCPAVRRIMNDTAEFWRLFEDGVHGHASAFTCSWADAAFARLEVGHKLAAALCLTDVPADMTVRAPWLAWSLVIPDDTLGALARVWCVGAEPAFLLMRDGTAHAYADRDKALDTTANQLLSNLIRGACLALSNPDDFRKESRRESSSSGHGKSARDGAPDLVQARFLLSAPVSIDLRDHLRGALSGRGGGGAPTVQFLVRGHWRNQAHGPKLSQRKEIWIQPFWKGPKESRVLLRQYTVDESEEHGER